MFAHAMADLGWSADQAWDTPMPWIDMALRAHARNRLRELRILTGTPEPEEPTALTTQDGEVDRPAVKSKLKGAFARMLKESQNAEKG